MDERRGVRAPYNFVPFSGRILLPYAGPAELPSHSELRPDLRSGELHVTLEAETPVFVSDGRGFFFRDAGGRYAIPGSTVRGITRENMQILGFGLLRPGEDLTDYQIYFRQVAAASKGADQRLRADYADALGVFEKKNPRTGRKVSVPGAVASGYLRRGRNGYVIRPTAGPYFRIDRSRADVQRLGAGNARTVPVDYRAKDGVVEEILPAGSGAPGMRRGMLLYTGRPVSRIPNPLYLFPEEDSGAPELPVPEEDILSFRVDLESRKKMLLAFYRDQFHFWELPAAGERKPVFYLSHKGHLYFGTTLFLRIGYQYPLSAGLPRRHREMMGQEDGPLDYPRAILGLASQKRSYRSRVSFGDLTAVGEPREEAPVRVMLAEPKPSYYPGYVVDGRHYNEVNPESGADADRFQLRGYKQYWLKPAQPGGVPPGKERVGSILRPLAVGTRFRGVIRFRNLTELELGLLLWSLRLEEGCFQTVGMGKPYGYGRMRLRIDRLRLLDDGRLYGGDLSADPWTDETDQVDRYIDRYDCGALAEAGGAPPARVRDQPEIQDFFFMKRTVRDGRDTSYMRLEEYRKVRTPLPAVRSIRDREEGRAEPGARPPKPPDRPDGEGRS